MQRQITGYAGAVSALPDSSRPTDLPARVVETSRNRRGEPGRPTASQGRASGRRQALSDQRAVAKWLREIAQRPN